MNGLGGLLLPAEALDWFAKRRPLTEAERARLRRCSPRRTEARPRSLERPPEDLPSNPLCSPFRNGDASRLLPTATYLTSETRNTRSSDAVCNRTT